MRSLVAHGRKGGGLRVSQRWPRWMGQLAIGKGSPVSECETYRTGMPGNFGGLARANSAGKMRGKGGKALCRPGPYKEERDVLVREE